MSDDVLPRGRPGTLVLRPSGLRVALPGDRTLLAAALDAGVRLRSSCRNGTCRACLARVIDGTVRHTVAWPGVSPDECAEGWVLPCVAIADGDVVLEQPLVDAAPPATGDAA